MKRSLCNYSWLLWVFENYLRLYLIIWIYKWATHLISSSGLGTASNFQLHYDDAQCIPLRICFPQDCMGFDAQCISDRICFAQDCTGVPSCCDGEMLGTSRIRICSDRIWKEGTAGWTRCGSFAFSSMLSDSSACSLHCMAPGLSKIFSQVKQKRTQNIQKYSQRARERDSFPNISYSTEISADRWCLNMKCGSSHDSWKFIFGEKEDQEIWKKTIQDSIDLKFAMQIM